MTETLCVHVAQCSLAGRKPVNDDACGIRIPEGTLLATKGIAAVIADGVSGSEAGREASETCVHGFLNDYYSTPESWTVKTSAERVLTALNHWLYGKGHRLHHAELAMLTTLSVLVIKSTTAHVFHVGDTRIYHLRRDKIDRLTRDHRLRGPSGREHLARAMGADLDIHIDYQAVPLEVGDSFLLVTDGVYEKLTDQALLETISTTTVADQAVDRLIERALENGSNDNLTCQILHVDRIPTQTEDEFYERLSHLRIPPPLSPGDELDGYRIVRELHASKRTQVYLAIDCETGNRVSLKTPSVMFEDDPEYIDRFLHEEWVGRRVTSPHVLKVLETSRSRRHLFYVTEHIDGQSLSQWRRDVNTPSLSQVRGIVEQLGKGLRALHRLEMVHQDLKPDNVLIDAQGTVKLIDFGCTRVAGIEEIARPVPREATVGTPRYTAPECLRGHDCDEYSDLFSLGVVTYELLTGHLPYGEKSGLELTRKDYIPAQRYRPELPVWVDLTLRKAVEAEPRRRYASISEFLHDLSHPRPDFCRPMPSPWLERDPAGFWRAATIALFLANLLLLYVLSL